jgi:hypothetical protein
MAASSSTFFNMKNGSETFTTHTFAPNNSGFTHPSKGQFTHFQTGGTRSTFGISSADFAELMGVVAQSPRRCEPRFLRRSNPVFPLS